MKYKILMFLISTAVVSGQQPYTTSNYSYEVTTDVEYGTVTDYAGNPFTLAMDLYKPVGDRNCLRPVIVLVHGGAWIAGSKEDATIVALAKEYAQRGWMAATINYRLGTHKASNYSMYAFCNSTLSQPCAYISDSAEVYRANYRGMQDAKGAIRFLKNRNALDSTDVGNVFIAGESAGGFVALAAAFTDQPSEKHPDCGSIADAPVPDADLRSYGCIPLHNDLSRPDLGSIDGQLHIGLHDASVRGVGSLYGGVLDPGMFAQNSEAPCVYLFHQGADVVVTHTYGRLLGRISWECFAQTNICQQYHFYPGAHGGESIRRHISALGAAAPEYRADIIDNYGYLNNCFSNGHAVDNLQQRLRNMLQLFADRITRSGNNPETNCAPLSVQRNPDMRGLNVYPNPSGDVIVIAAAPSLVGRPYRIYSGTGSVLAKGSLSLKTSIPLHALPAGTLWLVVGSDAESVVRIVKQ